MMEAPERIWACVSTSSKTGTMITLGHAHFDVKGWTEYVHADILKKAEAERDELAAVLDKAETDARLSSGGNMWRFFSDKALEMADKYQSARRERDILSKALREVIGMLDDPTGGEHVRDMRGATVIARAALNALSE